MARGAGCGCKLAPGLLAEALARMPGLPDDPDVLVGHAGLDDAAVYRLRDDLALVASVDFFTPMVDEPEVFGAIAATNALSDLYAMGATPLMALAVACFPRDVDPAVLGAVMRGGAETAASHGCPVLGGHTVDDPEPKYGLSRARHGPSGPPAHQRRRPAGRRPGAHQAPGGGDRHRRGGRGRRFGPGGRRGVDAPLQRPGLRRPPSRTACAAPPT